MPHSHVPTEVQDLRLETSRVLIAQAQQLLLGLRADPIPKNLIKEAQDAARDAINKIRRCQSHRFWRLNTLEQEGGTAEPEDIVIDLSR